jgi:hypothetical protein
LAIKLIIVGLRRSGTTIYWETFRQDERLLCYDEPFNRYLRVLPAATGLKAPEEFIRLVERDPQLFWEKFAPIPYGEELREGLSDGQLDYLRYLGDSGESVVLDTTRCQFKIGALRSAAPDAILVHLYRPPPSHISSHMLPSAPGWRGTIRKLARRRGFWKRRGNYNGWGFETIIEDAGRSEFVEALREIGLEPERVESQPAVAKLLAFWSINYQRAERDGRRHFGARFISQSFDSFCREPREAMARAYELLGMPLPQFDFDGIHPPHGPHDPLSPLWNKYSELLRLPEV